MARSLLKRESWSSKTVILALMGFSLIVGAIIIFCFGIKSRSEEMRVRNKGERTIGTVVTKSYNSGTEGPAYDVKYTFTTRGGQALTGSNFIDGSLWEKLEKGGPIDIIYDPADPASFFLVEGKLPFFREIIFYLLILAIIGILLLRWAILIALEVVKVKSEQKQM